MSRGKDMPEASDCAITGFKFFSDMDLVEHYIKNRKWTDAEKQTEKMIERIGELRECGISTDGMIEDAKFMQRMVETKDHADATDAFDEFKHHVYSQMLSS